MPIDASIPLSVRTPAPMNLEVPSPIQQFGQMLTLRGLMEQSQVRQQEMAQNQVKLDAVQRAQEAQAEFQRRLLAGEQMTPEQIVGRLGPTAGTDYLKARGEISEHELEQNLKKWGAINSLIGSATDTASHNRAAMQGVAMGLFDPEAARNIMAEGYDPDRQKQALQWSMSGKEQAQYQLDQARAAREAKESEARLANEQAQLRQRGIEYAAQTAPQSGLDWQTWRADLARQYPSVVGIIPQDYSPQAYKTVRGFAIKPEAPKPGVDVPFSADVLQQKKDLESIPRPPMSQGLFDQELKLRQATAQANRNASGLSQGQLNLVSSLAGRLDTHPEVKNFNTAWNQRQSMQTILNRKMGGPGDLAIVYQFMKALDPTSVVRESEYDAAAKSGNIFTGALARFNGYLNPNGGFLPDQVKQQFMQIVNDKLGASRKQVQDLYKDFGRRIEKITGEEPGTGTGYLTDYSNLYDQGGDFRPPGALPSVGDTYNGGRVKSVTRIK